MAQSGKSVLQGLVLSNLFQVRSPGDSRPLSPPPSPMGGAREEELVPLGSLAGAGLSLRPPPRESPSSGAASQGGVVNPPGTREVPLPPAPLAP